MDAATESAIRDALASASGLPAEKRLEHTGLYLIALSEAAPLPQAPARGEDEDMAEAEEAIQRAVAVAVATASAAAVAAGDGDGGEADTSSTLRLLGEHLCPKAARLPADAYLTHYELCRTPPYIIQIDAFLQFPGPGYHFSMSRVTEAKRQSWELIKHMQSQGKCDRLLLMSGNPAVGKSTWIEQVGAKEAGVESTVFFDDLLNNVRRRSQWWEGFRSSGLDIRVEVVVILRDFERAVVSNRLRGAKGGHEVPQHVMERYRNEAELPTLEEGFAAVRVFENTYNEETGDGGYVLQG